MDRFAKIFEFDDSQTLVMLTTTEDGHPTVKYTTMIDGVTVSAGPTWEPDDDSKPYDEEAAWEHAESAFEKVDESSARAVRAAIVKMTKTMVDPR